VVVVVPPPLQSAVGHGVQVSDSLSRSRAGGFSELVAFALIAFFPGFLPFFLSFTTTFVNAPHAELEPFGVTVMPSFGGPTFTFLIGCAEHPETPGTFTHALMLNVQDPLVAPSVSHVGSPSGQEIDVWVPFAS